MADENEQISESSTFLEYMMDNDVKSRVLNISQYTAMAVVPVIVLNKIMQHIFPQVDETKNNLEITFEVCGQLIMLFIGLYFIDRSIRYVKTYSGEQYTSISILNMILPFSILLLSIQSKMGQKFNIVVERLMVHFNIKKKDEKKIAVRNASLPIENDMRELVATNQETTNGRVSMPVGAVPPPPPPQQNQPPPSQNNPQNNFNQMYDTLDGGGGFSSSFSSF